MKTLPFLLLLVLIGCKKDNESIFTDAGTFTDTRDDHIYNSVKIGNQIWMSENLAYLPLVNPPADQSRTLPFYYVYNYAGSSVSDAKSNGNYTTYGVLYNWPAAMLACPSGWHLPSNEEFEILSRYSATAKRMKSQTGWSEDGNGNNLSGFKALPGGQRTDIKLTYFFSLGTSAVFWTSSEIDDTFSWIRGLSSSRYSMANFGASRDYGFSVRCLKDQ